MHAYAVEKYGEESILHAFVKSDLGEQTWNAHKHLNVPIVDNQSEWTPMQRNFLMLAADEHEPDPPNKGNINGRGSRKSGTGSFSP